MRVRLLPIFVFFIAMSHAHAKSTEQTPSFYQEQAAAYIATTKTQHPSLALLAQQHADFEPLWRELLRQQLITSKKKDSESISQAIALMLAIQYVPTYYHYADDPSINTYFQLQRSLLSQSQTDARLCRLLLNTQSSQNDQHGMPPWILEKKYRANIPVLQTAVNQLITARKLPWARQLPEEQNQTFMRRTINQMASIYGAESLAMYEQMNNENSSPDHRCLGLHQLYETINLQPLELRAQLIRSFFGGD